MIWDIGTFINQPQSYKICGIDAINPCLHADIQMTRILVCMGCNACNLDAETQITVRAGTEGIVRCSIGGGLFAYQHMTVIVPYGRHACFANSLTAPGHCAIVCKSPYHGAWLLVRVALCAAVDGLHDGTLTVIGKPKQAVAEEFKLSKIGRTTGRIDEFFCQAFCHGLEVSEGCFPGAGSKQIKRVVDTSKGQHIDSLTTHCTGTTYTC
ncbi:hypothetical protein ACA910_003575 [Epithemia clementina (nom. ined.)]